MADGPSYAKNARHYEGHSPASCSFRIYGNPTPETPGGVILAEGTGLTTEEVAGALYWEAEKWGGWASAKRPGHYREDNPSDR